MCVFLYVWCELFLEVKLSHIGQVKYHYSEKESKLNQRYLDEISEKLKRDIKTWIEGFEESGYQVECEDFATIYWWGSKSEDLKQNIVVETKRSTKHKFTIRIISGNEIFELMPKRIQRYIENHENSKKWKDNVLGIRQQTTAQ